MDNTPLICKSKETNKQNHHFLLPSPSCRCLIVGPSGCGKTNLLFRMLLNDRWLDYNNLFLYSRSLHQPEYKLITNCFNLGYSKKDLLNIFGAEKGNIDSFIDSLPNKGRTKIEVNSFHNYSEIPDPADVDLKKKNLFIFDDVMTDKNQNKAEDFYTRGRHNNISSFYIAQNYFKLPRQTIRSNANVLVIFNLPYKDLRHIYDDYCSADMDFCEFKKLCMNRAPFSYIVINRELKPSEGKYQVDFNSVYVPEKYKLSL